MPTDDTRRWERSKSPWHADAFPTEFKDRAPEQGDRKTGWIEIDWCGNVIGWVPDGTVIRPNNVFRDEPWGSMEVVMSIDNEDEVKCEDCKEVPEFVKNCNDNMCTWRLECKCGAKGQTFLRSQHLAIAQWESKGFKSNNEVDNA